MPSWNIHTAHVERLLADATPADLGVRDVSDFLFGNLVPDIYVGYMVPDASKKIEYRETHFADPEFIPAPDASEFYRRYVRGRDVDDLTLGAWTHLLCDHYYNMRTVEFIGLVGVPAGEQTRIRKQGDFDLFGRTLNIAATCAVTSRLLAQAAAFAQYAIDERDVRKTVEAQRAIVRANDERHVDGTPAYSLLTEDFFVQTFNEVDDVLHRALRRHVQGEDASGFGGGTA